MEIRDLLDRRDFEIAVGDAAAIPSPRHHLVTIREWSAHQHLQGASSVEFSLGSAFARGADALEIPRKLAPRGTVRQFRKCLCGSHADDLIRIRAIVSRIIGMASARSAG